MNRRDVIGGMGALALSPALPLQGERAAAASSLSGLALVTLGPSRGGPGNARWASLVAGVVNSPAVAGQLMSGRLDWRIDPASGAAEADLHCRVRCRDGRVRAFSGRRLLARPAAPGQIRLDLG